MPVDPSISLHVTGGATGLADPNSTAGTTANPMTAVQTYARTQDELNKVTLFRQQNAARQKFGQIASNSPNMEAAIEAASKDPNVAPFVPDIINTMSDTMKRVQEYKGLKSNQTYDAFTHTMDVLTGGLTDPNSVGKNFQNKLGNIFDREIRDTVSKAGSNIIAGLTDGLDKFDDTAGADGKPSPRSAEYARRLFAAGASTGTLGAMQTTAGASDQVDTGAGIQPGIRRGVVPTIMGPPGSFAPSGNKLMKGLPPQQGQVGAPIIGGAYGAGGGGSSSSSGAAGSAPAGGPDYSTQAADGKPLFDKSVDMTSPVISRGTGAGGGNVMSLDQQAQSHALSDRFNKEDYNTYQGAIKSLGMLDEMGRGFDELARTDPGQKSNFLTPGAGGETRLSIAKGANAVSALFGGNTVFDPNKIAAGEDLTKVTQRLGPSVLQSLLGQQREAAETILNMNNKGVPNINNTYLGGKLMISSIKQATQREVDLRNWKEAWLANPKNQGSLIGADAKFNDLHPATGYINKALDEYGLDKNGFKHLSDLEDAVRRGLLTPKQAAEQAKLQDFKLGQ